MDHGIKVGQRTEWKSELEWVGNEKVAEAGRFY